MLKQLFCVEQAQTVERILTLRVHGEASGTPFGWESRRELFVQPDAGPEALPEILAEMQQARDLGASARTGTGLVVCPGPSKFGLGTRMSPRPVSPSRDEEPHGAAGKEELAQRDEGVQAWEARVTECVASRRRILVGMAASYKISPDGIGLSSGGVAYRAFTHMRMTHAELFEEQLVPLGGAIDALAQLRMDIPGAPLPCATHDHSAAVEMFKESAADLRRAGLAVGAYIPVPEEVSARGRADGAYDRMLLHWHELQAQAKELGILRWLGLSRAKPRKRKV
jgi:hypothetical protein